MSDGKAQARVLLEAVVQRARVAVEQVRLSGGPTVGDELRWRTSVEPEEFSYDGDGAHVSGSRSGLYVVEAVKRANVGVVLSAVKESSEYKAAFKWVLERDRGAGDGRFEGLSVLLNLSQVLVTRLLQEGQEDEDSLSALVTAAAKKLEAEPLQYVVDVELTNLVVLGTPMHFSAGRVGDVTLRAVRAEDFAQDVRAAGFWAASVKPYLEGEWAHIIYPSAVMTIACESAGPEDRARRVLRVITALRLYEAAGVDAVWSKYSSEGGLYGGTIRGLSPTYQWAASYVNAIGRSPVRAGDEERLVAFVQEIAPKMPVELVSAKRDRENYITIAYDRYCDALFRGASVDARIATAVMGLDGVLMNSGPELSFRLASRAAQLLGAVGCDPEKVWAVVRASYGVRSKYVHGSRAPKKLRKKVEKDFGGMWELVMMVLDYLRRALVVYLTVEVSKEELMGALDRAPLSERAKRELWELLEPARKLLDGQSEVKDVV